MLHLDFDFQIEPTKLVVVGWCGTESLNALYLQGDDHVIFPTLVSDHARRDLRSDELRGFIAVFDVDAKINLLRYEFRAEGEGSLFPLGGETENFELFVSKSVDETFWDFCLRIGTRDISVVGSELVSVIRPRIKSMIGNYAETPKMAGGLDQALATQANNVALLSGWTASDRAQTAQHPLQRSGFALCKNALVPLKMHWDCHLRPDLGAFGDRFSLTGSEGYAGFVHTQTDHGPIETLIICARYNRGQFVLAREVDDVAAIRLLAAAQQMDEQLTSRDFIADIRAALRPKIKAIELKSESVQHKEASHITLVLEHDGGDHDIRDVLRYCRHELGHGFDLIVIRNSLSRALKRAIAAFQNEAGDRDMVVTCFASDHPINQWNIRGAIVVFARSSALVQLSPFPEIRGNKKARLDASVTLHAPILAIAEKPDLAQLATQLAAQRIPMIAMVNMAVLPSEAKLFGGLSSVDAQVRLLVLSLLKVNRAQVSLASPVPFFDGMAGRQIDKTSEAQILYDLAGLDSEAISYAFAKAEHE